ncbi:MAG: DUF2508 family protein [Alicyclobacillaceae bacterium]|nr:DUF2508 family protein [Alicyclobacillaceae bacterium]
MDADQTRRQPLRPAAPAGAPRFEPAEHSPVDVASFIRELRRCKREVEIARQQFDTVDDPLLIDHVVFRLGAAEKRFNYLFQLARKLDIAAEGMRWEWYDED